MTVPLLIATRQGFWIAEPSEEGWQTAPRGLEGHHLTSIIAREGVILVGTTDGIFRSSDGGARWEEASHGLSSRHVRWLAYHPDRSDSEFAGTEPANIFVSEDGGSRWEARPEVAALRDHHGWYLPYSPEAGCVRGFAFHGDRLYAAIEVGGLLRSDDGGATWRLASGSTGQPLIARQPDPWLPADVHSVAGHPSSPELVFAPTHQGLFRSDDGGARWEALYGNCYSRAVWVDPTDAAHIVFAPATHNGWHGTIVVSHDGGASWTRAGEGLALPWPKETLVERLVQVGDKLLAVRSDGQLFIAPLATLVWQSLLPDRLPPVEAVTTMVP